MKYHAETKKIKSFNPVTLTIVFENMGEVDQIKEAFQNTCIGWLKDVSDKLDEEINKNNS